MSDPIRRSGKRLASAVFVAALLIALFPALASAETVTDCPMNGFTPSSQAIRFDLPDGAPSLAIEAHSSRSLRIGDETDWHLADGLIVVNAETLQIMAARVESFGNAPRSVVARGAGADVGPVEAEAADSPFYHSASWPAPALSPGTYYAIAFGASGGAPPRESWSFDLRIGGVHPCTPSGTGSVFDLDQTQFTGGTEVYAPGVGSATGIQCSFVEPSDVSIVAGLMDAEVQGPGDAQLAYATPLGSGALENSMTPFISTAGPHSFTADFTGLYPQILVTGAALTLN